jgi:hypothetical protein
MSVMKKEMMRAIYVRDRDGDSSAWYRRWQRDGYTLMDLNIQEADTDGRIGHAFEAQGPLVRVAAL